MDWFNAVERTYAFLAEASFVVQHRAVLLRSKPSVKVRKLVKSGSPTCAFDLFCVCTHLFPPRCALRVFTPRFPQKLTGFPFFSRNSLVKTGLWTGSCHFISARFVVCDVHACVCLVFLLLCVCLCVCVPCGSLRALIDAWYVAACRRVWSYRAPVSSRASFWFFLPVCNLL